MTDTTTEAHHHGPQNEQLKRSISGPQLFFYVLGDVLGSGIYGLIGLVAVAVGGAIWVPFGVGVGVAMLTGFAYAEMITKYPQAAGAALYVSKAFKNDFFTFLVSFLMLAATVSAAGALALTFGSDYFKEFINSPTTLTAIGLIVVLGLINFRGISESVWVNIVMTLIEVTGLIIILVIGVMTLSNGDADLARPFEFNGDKNPALLALTGAAIAFFAMTGFENAANVVEETKEPSRVFPKALLGGITVAGLLYLLVSFIASMVVPTDQLAANETSALLEVVREGPLGIPLKLFALIALVAITNTALVTLVAQARIMYGMAKQGAFPRIFARCHRTRRTPWVAILFTSTAAIVLILVAPVDDLATVTSLFLIAVFGLVCVSALMLRKETVEHDHYVAPTWLLMAGVVANAGLLAYTLYDSWTDLWVYVVGIMVAGLVLFFVNMATKPAADRRIEVEKAEEPPA